MGAGSDAVIAAALQYWQQHQGNGSTPNFYNVPPTPSEEWLLQRQKDLDKYSPARDYISSYADQFLKGVNYDPSGFKFMSPNLQGQPFAGGLSMPKIDFSKMPEYWKNPTATAPTKVGTTRSGEDIRNTPAGSPIDRGPRNQIGGDNGDTGFGNTIADALGNRNPGNSAAATYGNQLPGTFGSAAGDAGAAGMNYTSHPMFAGLAAKAGEYMRTEGARIGWTAAKAGLTAIFGPLGTMAGQAAQWAWNHYHQPAAAPNPGNGGRAGGQGGT